MVLHSRRIDFFVDGFDEVFTIRFRPRMKMSFKRADASWTDGIMTFSSMFNFRSRKKKRTDPIRNAEDPALLTGRESIELFTLFFLFGLFPDSLDASRFSARLRFAFFDVSSTSSTTLISSPSTG